MRTELALQQQRTYLGLGKNPFMDEIILEQLVPYQPAPVRKKDRIVRSEPLSRARAVDWTMWTVTLNDKA